MIIPFENYIKHYGIPRKSGRYPWGSGDNPYQRNASFLGMVDDLKKQGLTEKQIADGLGMTTTQLRARKSIAKNENKQADISTAQRLKDRGWSTTAIADRMGIPESTARTLLAPGAADKAKILDSTAEMLASQVEKKQYLDIGKGVEYQTNVSRNKIDNAVAKLCETGYKVQYVRVKQLGTGNYTSLKVLTKDDVSYSELFKNQDKIQQITDFSEDGGRTYLGLKPPVSVDSSRVMVRYAEDGGSEADGVIFLRPGVEDLSMGKSNYAQVRIAVDDTHYLKGMAVYNSDMPKGVDLVFNTNKTRQEAPNKLDAMKKMTGDADNPFGATIKPNGQRGVLNIVNEEGDWETWSRTLSSQMLGKQTPSLAKQQLAVTYERKRNELDQILTLTNPTVKERLLEAYADGADSASVHLKAAAMPRQNSSVLLPVNSLKPTEIYSPNHKDGERVVLIRHPHGGIFEIPELVVNNKHPEARRLIGPNARDAVGINSKVAERLSGADFDGDTVLVIPNNAGRVKNAPALEGLKNFDPRASYPAYEGMPVMTARQKQIEMGKASNLITDMTLRGANPNEIARAVRHSMVVIDAEKHKLNYKQSEKDNGIPQLKEKYQGGAKKGAATLLSRATSEIRVNERAPRSAADGGPIDRATGKKMYVDTGESYVNAKGQVVTRQFKSKRLAETDDAHTLSSGTKMEEIYANHSNSLKALANEARREMVRVEPRPYSPSARAAYQAEVDALSNKLRVALSNAPLERQAQVIANSIVAQKKQARPDLEPDQLKKVQNQALAEARVRTGAKKNLIDITDREWEAIQAGAISPSRLKEILNNTDLDRIKELATPRTVDAGMSAAQEARARSMAALGYTQAEIAEQLGFSVSTIMDAIDDE